MRASFGANVLDGDRRLLLRDDSPVPLSPKAFKLLELLLERRPKPVSKAELLENVWSGVFVAEANLAIRVNEVRRAIGDDPKKPLFIRTVYGFGYAFTGDVAVSSHAARPLAVGALHRLVWGASETALAEGENVLGRDSDGALWVADSSVSRRHARIVVEGELAVLEDLASKNGTSCNGIRVTKPLLLNDGDEITIGSVTLRFRRVSASASTESRSSRTGD